VPEAIISPSRLARDLGRLGVRPAGVLAVHMSYRAVRPVAGGPAGVIEALRLAVGPEGTMVMPSWTGNDDAPFEPHKTPADASLGVTADMFWRRPEARRSDHPFAFAALGPKAESITGDPIPIPPHGLESPIGRVYESDGQVLLLGVGHDANTTMHLAEGLARVPYSVPKHCTILKNGHPLRIDYREIDHCCRRFTLVDDWLRPTNLQQEGPAGHAHARLMRSRDVVAAVRERLQRDPLLFLHPRGSGCTECEEAHRSIT